VKAPSAEANQKGYRSAIGRARTGLRTTILRGTNEATLSLFHRAYRTLEWKAQSSSWLGSVKLSVKSGIPESRDRHAISPVMPAARIRPDLSRTKSKFSTRSKSERERASTLRSAVLLVRLLGVPQRAHRSRSSYT
jgi:hypothetical protein